MNWAHNIVNTGGIVVFLCCRDVELSTTLVLKLHCALSRETKRLDLSFVINLLKAVKYSHWFDSDCIFFVFILGAISVWTRWLLRSTSVQSCIFWLIGALLEIILFDGLGSVRMSQVSQRAADSLSQQTVCCYQFGVYLCRFHTFLQRHI